MNDTNDAAGRTFRFACPAQETDLAAALLAAQGYEFEPEPFSPLALRLVSEPRPLGSSIANFFGFIYVQDKSSMLPPLLLAPEPGAAVIDMCASPGGKTGLLALAVGRAGFVLANETSRTRLETLRRNLDRTNAEACGSCGFPGQDLPLPDGRWPYILLDPPCSGLGTLDKHPEARRWQGAKAEPLVQLQRLLLARAAALLAPGGSLMYSTCTTSPDENEAQTAWAVEHLGLRLAPLETPPGFVLRRPALPGLDGVLPVDGDASGSQGFYLARMTRPGTPEPLADRHEPSAKGRPLSAAERTACGDAGADLDALPPGTPCRFGESAFLLQRPSSALLPSDFPWQGLPLGRFQAGRFRPNPRLRALLPRDPACAVHAESVADIERLLAGQALAAPAAPCAVLHFQGRPLCRLAVKGKRALWSER